MYYAALIFGTILLACSPDSGDRQQDRDDHPATPMEVINERLEENPRDASAYADRARLHYENANYGDAILDMASAMRIDSINEAYHHLLSDIYLDSHRSQLALQTMERATVLFPESVDTWLKMAELQIILKLYDAAGTSLRKVQELDPYNIEGLYLLGYLYQEQGETERAIQSFQTVVELDADHAEAWTSLGNLLDMKGDPMALQCFENAIISDSTYAQGWHSKAYYLQNHDRIPEAIDIYEKLHRIAPEYSDAYLNAGILYLEQGELSSAEEEIRIYTGIDSTNPLGYYYLGVIYERKGATGEAREFYSHAERLAPGARRIERALERLSGQD